MKHWIETNFEKKKLEYINNTNDIDDHSAIEDHKSLFQQIREANLEGLSQLKDSRFHGPLFAVEHLSSLKVSLVITLHDTHFSIENQDTPFPYDSSTKGLIKAIDSGRLLPDLIDLLNESTAHFYDGCIIVELRDARGKKDTSKPTVRKVLLKPDEQTIIHDIQQMASQIVSTDPTQPKELTPEELLLAEQKILLAMHPDICLSPSLKVAYISNALHYNAHKFNTKRKRDQALEPTLLTEKEESQNGQGAKPKLVSLLNFLEQREKQAPKEQEKPSFSTTVHKLLNQKVTQAQMKDPKPAPPKLTDPATIIHALNNRRIRFRGIGNTFCFFQVLAKRPYGFEGLMRVGKLPDTGAGDIIRFPLGNSEAAEQFVNQLKYLYEKEGLGVLEYDSFIHGDANDPGLVTAPDPNLANMNRPDPTPTGPMISIKTRQEMEMNEQMRKKILQQTLIKQGLPFNGPANQLTGRPGQLPPSFGTAPFPMGPQMNSTTAATKHNETLRQFVQPHLGKKPPENHKS